MFGSHFLLQYQELGKLRAAFDIWREFAVRRATGHTGRKWQNNEEGEGPTSNLRLFPASVAANLLPGRDALNTYL